MSGQRRRLPLVVGWLPTFLAFPIGGLIAIETVGARDAALPGLAGGLIVGLVLGVAQWLVLRGHGVGLRWVPITVVAFAGGAAVATVVTDGGTKLADVVVAAV